MMIRVRDGDIDLFIKMIFFDLEGTLVSKRIKLSSGGISKTIWTAVAESLGPNALKEEEETIKKWKRGEYRGYLEWMEETIRIHLKYQLNRTMFESIIQSAEYFKGVKEAFDFFNKDNIRTVILTGGFKTLAERVQMELNVDHAISSCEYIWDKDGKLKMWNLVPCYGYGKALFLRSIMRDYKLDKRDCAFIGDADDDVYAAREVGLSIAFNGSVDLKKECSIIIDQPEGREDFSEILRQILA